MIFLMVTSSLRLSSGRLLVGANQNACVTQFIVLSTNKFHVHLRLFRVWLQVTSKWGNSKKVADGAQPSVSLLFFSHFDLFCDVLVNTDARKQGIYLSLKMNKQKLFIMTSSMHLSPSRALVITNENACIIQFIIQMKIALKKKEN